MGRKFSTEYRAEAVRMILDNPGTTVKLVRRDLGVGVSTLDKWLKSARQSMQGSELGPNERDELRKLRQENQKLKLERELLKKAAVFFANNGSS